MFRWKGAAAVLAISALALTGCSAANSGASEHSADTGGTLVLGDVAAPTTFDAQGAGWGNYSIYYQAVYDTLLLETSDGAIKPFLATKYSYNADRTQLTLSLRTGVKFSDGSTLNAEAVKANLDRYISGDAATVKSNDLSTVKSVTTSGTSTVVLHLDATDPGLLRALTEVAGLVQSPKSFDNKDLATNPDGTGPYVLDTKDTVTGTSYVFTKNKNYWNPSVQHYSKLTINVLSDATANLNAIKAGELNGTTLANNTLIAPTKAAGWTVETNSLDFQGLLLFDRSGSMSPALGNVKVRQAINCAFDRKALLKAVQQGAGEATDQVFPASSHGYDKSLESKYPYDVKKAKSLLAEAGYANGFTIEMPNSAALGSVYTIVQQQLSAIGITVKPVDTGNNFIADMLAPKYPATFMSLGQVNDWNVIQSMIAPKATFNPFHSTDPTVAKLIGDFQNGDEAAQAKAARSLNAYIVDQAWFAPWYRVQGNYATDAHTSVTMMSTNAYPNLYDFTPKS
ncbi:ABC transporter substrate-binding protein [Humibacter antri]